MPKNITTKTGRNPTETAQLDSGYIKLWPPSAAASYDVYIETSL